MRCLRSIGIVAFLSVLVLFVLLLGDTRSQASRIQVLIVTGNDVRAHDWRQTTAKIREYLEEGDRFEVKVAEDPGIFESSTIKKYDVIVNNFGHWSTPDLTPAGQEGLLGYVRDGGGLVSLHFACAAFQDWAEYPNLIGRIWKKGVGGHGPRGKFVVKIDKPDHPITAGMSDFEMDDELYAKLTGEADLEVLASAKSEWTGNVEPIIFVKGYGKGRVFHDVLGHDVRAQEHPSYKKLIRRGVEWAATGKVTVD